MKEVKVNFLLIGSARSATTSLSAALSQHPDISFSDPKEPQFFSKEDWRTKLDQYHSLFKTSAKLYGEGSTNYSKYPHYNNAIHSDIYEYNPDMKIIYIMRHPVDRIISHYIHAYNRGHETNNNFEDTIITNSHYIDTSKYAMQIAPYIQQFGKANVLLLFFEDFKMKPQEVTHNVFDFLGLKTITLDVSILNTNKSFNRRILDHKYDNPKTLFKKIQKVFLILQNYFNSDFISEKPTISDKTKSFILERCHEDILKIEALTNRDLSHWKV